MAKKEGFEMKIPKLKQREIWKINPAERIKDKERYNRRREKQKLSKQYGIKIN